MSRSGVGSVDGRRSGVPDGSVIRVGVIGCGGMGGWHADNLDRQPGVSVTACADVVPAAAEAVAQRLGAEVRDGDALAAADDVDAILIASSDASHARYAVAAIARRTPCFVEKPLGETLEQADRILDAEVAAGRRLARVGFMRELDPAHQQVVEQLADLGPITRIRSVHRNVDPARRTVEVLFAQSLIHDIHTIRRLSGEEVASVRGHVVTRSDGFRDVLMVCVLESGALGLVDFEDQAFAYEVQVEVTAERGMVATVPHPRAVVRRDGEESLPVGADWFSRFEEAYRLEIEEWVAGLRTGTPTGPSVWDGYAAQVVADAAMTSLRDNTEVPVTLPPVPELYR
ncbi:MAG: Gfo/Idh/MocA family oxidoreductase [Actinomycetota bacterium]